MKKRVLFCGDFTGLSTGYAVYWREVINRLYQTGKYEIAEFASYVHHNDPRTNNVPWHLYCNLPDKDDQAAIAEYEASNLNHFGAWRFEYVALDFKPDIVCGIRDFWMESFIGTSPFRKCFDWMWMAPCDAEPQNETWIDVFATTDRLLTYTDWARGVIKKQAGDHINYGKAASPSAEACFVPVEDKDAHKELFGLQGTKIIGTVMRNQRRKLYPDLFKVFRKYLDQTKEVNTYLYCHTSYPDLGWDIPALLQENGIQHRTLFTYRCKSCGHAYPDLFKQGISTCNACGQHSVVLAGVNNGLDSEGLAKVYNIFDVYVQYANSEGFGMPVVEAASCGVPVMAVDYSAMSETVKRVNGIPLKVAALSKELETGCDRAIPDNDYLLSKLVEFMLKPNGMRRRDGHLARQGAQEHYGSWDNVAKIWEEEIDNLDTGLHAWNCPLMIREANQNFPDNMTNEQFVNFLFAETLGQPEYVGSFMATRMLRDLNMGTSGKSQNGLYFNEDSVMFSRNHMNDFTRQHALEHILRMVDYRNTWENQRRLSLESMS